MLSLLAVLLLALAPEAAESSAGPTVEVKTVDGRALSGSLEKLDAAGLTLQTAEGEDHVALGTLISVAPAEKPKPSAARPLVLVELVDGSTLRGDAFTATGKTAAVQLAEGLQLELPARALATVRYLSEAPQLAEREKLWADLVRARGKGDRLIVRKKESLDYLEGVIRDVTAEGVKFELDGQAITVKRAKIEGLAYYQADAAAPREAVCAVHLGGGARLFAASVQVAGGRLEISTPSAGRLALPWGRVEKLDFTSGKVQYLSDLEPESVEYVPYFGLAEEPAAFAEFFKPRRDQAPEGRPLRLDGKDYAKGLAVHSRTTLAYALPGRFEKFTALLGIDDHAGPGGHAVVQIKGDQKTLWQGPVKAGQPAVALDLDVVGVRKLTLVVDFGENFDVGDQVNFCDAQVSKLKK